MRFLICMFFLIVLFSCETKNSKSEGFKENTAFNELLAIEKTIFNDVVVGKSQKISKKGKDLLMLSQAYIASNPSDTLLERVYEMAALGAEIGGLYNDAVNYLYLAQRNFPESEKASIYLFNRARILDDILQKKKQSILAYQELIELYPNDSISISMKAYLESDLMQKSEAELLDFFNSNN
ncbi:MAG: hypothetical protein P8M12_07750 [Flavobacteriales bacterium]|nr:hypothetical protein [Flavobacteriales bacterium]